MNAKFLSKAGCMFYTIYAILKMYQPASPSSLSMRGVAAAVPRSRRIMAEVADFIVDGWWGVSWWW